MAQQNASREMAQLGGEEEYAFRIISQLKKLAHSDNICAIDSFKMFNHIA